MAEKKRGVNSGRALVAVDKISKKEYNDRLEKLFENQSFLVSYTMSSDRKGFIMEFKRGGFVYEWAYGLVGSRPYQTSLCRLFWRCVLMIVPWVFVICLALIVIAFAGFTGFFVAGKPSLFSEKETESVFVPYESWPTVAGKRVYPIWVIIAAGVIYFLFTTDVMSSVTHAVGEAFLSAVEAFPVVFSIVGLIIIIGYMVKTTRKAASTFRESEGFRLVEAFIKAKKEKVCPIVKFVD